MEGAATGVTMKVSEKGALSIYGMGRFPVTLYKGCIHPGHPGRGGTRSTLLRSPRVNSCRFCRLVFSTRPVSPRM
jgi:hypothetical protein